MLTRMDGLSRNTIDPDSFIVPNDPFVSQPTKLNVAN